MSGLYYFSQLLTRKLGDDIESSRPGEAVSQCDTLSADIHGVASPLSPLPLGYGGRCRRQRTNMEPLLPAEARVCSFLLFRNDPPYLRTTGAKDDLTRPNTGKASTMSRDRDTGVEIGGKWSPGPLEALSFLPATYKGCAWSSRFSSLVKISVSRVSCMSLVWEGGVNTH